MTDYLENSESQLLHVTSQEKKGLLYGVPVSLKDSIDCKVQPMSLMGWRSGHSCCKPVVGYETLNGGHALFSWNNIILSLII